MFIMITDGYCNGDSEIVIGKWLKKHDEGFRKKMIIATKVFFPMDAKDPNAKGLSRKHIMDAVEGSLKRLQTDYIDLYQIHFPSKGTPIEETFQTLNNLIEIGKVRYVGVSNVCGWQLQRIINICDKFKWASKPISLQPQYNLLARGIELELTDLCELEGIKIIPWSPLASGWLAGKYTKDMKEPPQESRAELEDNLGINVFSDRINDEMVWNVLNELKAQSEELKCSISQISIRWLIEKNTVPIIGVRKLDHLVNNMKALDVKLEPRHMEKLDKASEIKLFYPYSFLRLFEKMDEN